MVVGTEMSSPYVSQMALGDTVVTLIAYMRNWRWQYRSNSVSAEDVREATPEADADGKVRLDFVIAHISTGGHSVVVDPGGVTEDYRVAQPEADFTPGLEAGLSSVGLTLAGVTHVLVTHPHGDHFRGVSQSEHGAALTFPNAKHVVSRLDWEDETPESAMLRAAMAQAAGSGQIEVVEPDLELLPGLTLMHTPGETSGHFCVRVASQGRAFYWLGDLVHHRLELRHLDWVLPWGDSTLAAASRRRVMGEAADTNAIVVWAHAPFPGWGILSRDGEGFGWSTVGVGKVRDPAFD